MTQTHTLSLSRTVLYFTVLFLVSVQMGCKKNKGKEKGVTQSNIKRSSTNCPSVGGNRNYYKRVSQNVSKKDLILYECSRRESAYQKLMSKFKSMNPVPTIKILTANAPDYFGKKVSVVGFLELYDGYFGKYHNSKNTHYAFEFEMFGAAYLGKTIRIYAERKKYRKLFNFVALMESNISQINKSKSGHQNLFKLTIKMNKGDSSYNDVWTLLRAEPLLLWKRGLCCSRQR